MCAQFLWMMLNLLKYIFVLGVIRYVIELADRHLDLARIYGLLRFCSYVNGLSLKDIICSTSSFQTSKYILQSWTSLLCRCCLHSKFF